MRFARTLFSLRSRSLSEISALALALAPNPAAVVGSTRCPRTEKTTLFLPRPFHGPAISTVLAQYTGAIGSVLPREIRTGLKGSGSPFSAPLVFLVGHTGNVDFRPVRFRSGSHGRVDQIVRCRDLGRLEGPFLRGRLISFRYLDGVLRTESIFHRNQSALAGMAPE